MKVGISTATFFSKVLTEDSFSVIKRCGGETAEVFLTTYYEYEPSFGSLLQQRKGDAQVYSVHALNTQFEPQLFNMAPRTRLDGETLFRKVLAVAQTIGAKVYTFHGQSRLKKTAYLDPVATGKRLAELGDIASEYGVKLCLENVHWAAFNTPEFYAKLKEHAPNVGTVLDIKQAWQSGYDWREYLDVMGQNLSNVHVSDVKDGEIKMVGQGDFPFKELVCRLTDSGYGGPPIIEQYSKNYGSYDEVALSVEYLKNIIGGIRNADQV